MKAEMMMKTNRMSSVRVLAYWMTTIFTALELLVGGVADLVHGRTVLVAGEPVADGLTHLGYPLYLLTILGVWKMLGAIALLVPRFPRLKEWAYAGTFFVFAGAVASGVARGLDDPSFIWPPFIFAVLTLASWVLRPQSRTLGVLFSLGSGGKRIQGFQN
jgi:uncharacterized membrane protein YphA (DoxX/SURF4 family)